MKTAIKLTTGILAVAVMAGGLWAQNPDAIDNARSVAKSLQQKQANDTNAALNAAGVPAQQTAKPAPGAPAPAVKPAVLPSSKPAQTQTAAKPAQTAPVPKPATVAAKPASAPAAKPATAPAAQPAQAKTGAAPAAASKPVVTAKPVVAAKSAAPKAAAADKKAEAPKPDAKKQTAKETKPSTPAAKPAPEPAKAEAAKPAKTEEKKEDKKWAMSSKRDPFFSPVVQAAGSGCSTGKKCLEIGQINLRGVVKSDNGFIAVVTNNLNKAYFLRENDPVFNGYVVRITGDSVVFQETVQDKLGKSFTREVVKKIFTPAV